ncbi:MAG: alpha-galactosidase [Clostridia bacterium]|nr:alpha-galactosidase [Clostridia bacterium]
MKKAISALLLSALLLLAGCETVKPPETTGTVTDPQTTAEETEEQTEADKYNGYGEKAMKQLQAYFDDPAGFPFSFKYNGKKITGFGDGFSKESEERREGSDGENYTVRFIHNDSGAVFKVRAKSYYLFDAWEWTVYITNNGDSATMVFSDISAADATFEGGSPVLKGINGDLGDMYAPYTVDLTKKTVKKNSTSGRPTHGQFPYFNLEYGDGGVFLAVGWPGCWRASFDGKNGQSTHYTAGQNKISTRLLPGETIRTPLVTFLRYEGRDEAANMNLWRRWFIECNMRKDSNGDVIQPVIGWGSVVQGTTTHSLKRTINSYLSHGVKLDYFWLDAGWYVNADGRTCSWPETGTWVMNTEKFPDKFAEVSDLMHENGGKTLLWFEPEVVRCNKDKFLEANPDFKPEWFLGTAAAGSWLEGQLVDLGNEELRAWLLGRICTVLDEGKIDMYRQDFNVDPAQVWSSCDGKGRTGITENKYVTGYLQLWDAILERYPDMTIDSCASGGGRNDLETMRRAVPLHISDYWDGQNGRYDERQAVLLSLSAWLPYFKLQVNSVEELTEYRLRSCMAPWINMNVPSISKSTPWDQVRKTCDEWKRLSKLFYADFYPLTDHSAANNVWRAWEYYDAETNEGAVLVFRAEKSRTDTMTLKLHADPALTYTVKDCDGLIDAVISGKELSENGVEIRLGEPASSALIFIKGQAK